MKGLELDIAIKNLQTFSIVQKYDRMIVNNNNYWVQIDNRYAQWFNRWYNSDSRTDLIKPIKLTYERAIKEYLKGELSYKTILDSLNNLFNVCVFTYQDFDELHKLIMNLRGELEVAASEKKENTINHVLPNNKENFDIESQEYISDDEIPNTFWNKAWNECKSVVYKYIIKPIKRLFKRKYF